MRTVLIVLIAFCGGFSVNAQQGEKQKAFKADTVDDKDYADLKEYVIVVDSAEVRVKFYGNILITRSVFKNTAGILDIEFYRNQYFKPVLVIITEISPLIPECYRTTRYSYNDGKLIKTISESKDPEDLNDMDIVQKNNMLGYNNSFTAGFLQDYTEKLETNISKQLRLRQE